MLKFASVPTILANILHKNPLQQASLISAKAYGFITTNATQLGLKYTITTTNIATTTRAGMASTSGTMYNIQ